MMHVTQKECLYTIQENGWYRDIFVPADLFSRDFLMHKPGKRSIYAR